MAIASLSEATKGDVEFWSAQWNLFLVFLNIIICMSHKKRDMRKLGEH